VHVAPEPLVLFEPFTGDGLEGLSAGRNPLGSTDDASLDRVDPVTQLSANGIPRARRRECDSRIGTDSLEPLNAAESVLDAPHGGAGFRMREEEAAAVRELCHLPGDRFAANARTLASDSLLMPFPTA